MYKQILKWVVIGLSGVLAVIAGFYLVTRSQGIAAWERYEREARARGVKLDLEEVQLPEVPDEENFFMAPIFGAGGTGVGGPFDRQKLTPKNVAPPGAVFSTIEFGKRLDLRAWRERCEQVLGGLEQRELEDGEVVLNAIEPHSAALEALAEATHRPQSKIPTDWLNPDDTALAITMLSQAGDILALRSEARMRTDETKAACDDVMLLLELADRLAKEPPMIAYMIRLDLITRAASVVWSGMSERRWDAETLQRIQVAFANQDMLAGGVRALNGERALANETFKAILRPRLETRNLRKAVWSSFAIDHRLAQLYPRGWIWEDQLRVNLHYDHLLEEFDVSVRRYVPLKSSGPPSSHITVPIRVALSDLMRVADLIADKALRAEVLCNQVVIASELEKRFLGNGSYPDRLSNLEPRSDSLRTTDIFDGAVMRYRLDQDRGYVLYSIGKDCVDNGGAPPEHKAKKRNPDWVWTFPEKVEDEGASD